MMICVGYVGAVGTSSATIPERLGTLTPLAMARELEHTFLHPPTLYNLVMYATKYASQSQENCVA